MDKKLGREMNIKDFQKSQRVLDEDIRNYISKRLADFREETGFTPSDVWTYMIEDTKLGDLERSYMLHEVKTKFNFGY